MELGTAVLKVCRKLGVSEQTFYRSYGASERRGCMVLKLNRGSLSAQAEAEQAFLRMWIREIAQVRVRYGYRRIHVDNGPEFISKALDA